jgi:hypothetical protein
MQLTKRETELLSALVYFLNMGMINIKQINKQYFNSESFINELDLSIGEELEEKLDYHLQWTK